MTLPRTSGSLSMLESLDLWGMLANFLYSGHYALPKAHPQIKKWFRRMVALKRTQFIS